METSTRTAESTSVISSILADNFGRQRESTPAATTSAQPSALAIDLAFAKAEESLIDDTLLVLSAA